MWYDVDFFSSFFFFSSRRRHTRCLSDWSSDVCSSDLIDFDAPVGRFTRRGAARRALRAGDQKRQAEHAFARQIDADRSEERRVGKSVDLGGRGIIKKQNER